MALLWRPARRDWFHGSVFMLNGSAVYLKDCSFKIIIDTAYLTSLKNLSEVGSLDLALYFSLLDGLRWFLRYESAKKAWRNFQLEWTRRMQYRSTTRLLITRGGILTASIKEQGILTDDGWEKMSEGTPTLAKELSKPHTKNHYLLVYQQDQQVYF